MFDFYPGLPHMVCNWHVTGMNTVEGSVNSTQLVGQSVKSCGAFSLVPIIATVGERKFKSTPDSNVI